MGRQPLKGELIHRTTALRTYFMRPLRAEALPVFGGEKKAFTISACMKLPLWLFRLVRKKNELSDQHWRNCRRAVTRADSSSAYCVKRFRYSVEVMKAFTISASTKFPLNEFSLFNQNSYPE